ACARPGSTPAPPASTIPTPSPRVAPPPTPARAASAPPCRARRPDRSPIAAPTPTATTACSAPAATTATTWAASTPSASPTTNARPTCSASWAPATRPASSCARRRQCSGDLRQILERHAFGSALAARPLEQRAAHGVDAVRPPDGAAVARPVADEDDGPAGGARRVADLAFAHRAAPARQLGMREVDLDAPVDEPRGVEVSPLERPEPRPEQRLDVEVEPARRQPHRGPRAPRRGEERIEARPQVPDLARIRERVGQLGTRQRPHLALRVRQRDLVAHPGGVDVAPRRRGEAIADLVANVLLRHGAIEIEHDDWTRRSHHRYIYRGSRHEARGDNRPQPRQAGAVPDQGSGADPSSAARR